MTEALGGEHKADWGQCRIGAAARGMAVGVLMISTLSRLRRRLDISISLNAARPGKGTPMIASARAISAGVGSIRSIHTGPGPPLPASGEGYRGQHEVKGFLIASAYRESVSSKARACARYRAPRMHALAALDP